MFGLANPACPAMCSWLCNLRRFSSPPVRSTAAPRMPRPGCSSRPTEFWQDACCHGPASAPQWELADGQFGDPTSRLHTGLGGRTEPCRLWTWRCFREQARNRRPRTRARGEGRPDPDHISTSYAERANLSIRMGNCRLTRLTNAFSKKAENHVHNMAVYFMRYNFARAHQTLRCTPGNGGWRHHEGVGAGRYGEGVGGMGGAAGCLTALEADDQSLGNNISDALLVKIWTLTQGA